MMFTYAFIKYLASFLTEQFVIANLQVCNMVNESKKLKYKHLFILCLLAISPWECTSRKWLFKHLIKFLGTTQKEILFEGI